MQSGARIIMQTPEWLATLETLTFVGLIGMGVYNRVVNWRKFHERTTKLENLFEQYQKDLKIVLDGYMGAFSRYMETCETCRTEVRVHHEADARHVTVDLREQIKDMAASIKRIETILMEKK
jgi:hypothetical protein